MSEKRCRQMIQSYNMIFAMTIIDLLSESAALVHHGDSSHPFVGVF